MLGIIVLLKGPTSPKPQVCDGLHHIVIQYLLVLKRIHGTGKLQRVQGTMNSLQYQEILDDNVMQSVTNLRLGRRWTFQQDNDPKHTSKFTRAWLQIKGWNILEWPSQSPDLNPIENLWWDLKKAVAVRKPKNVTELEAFAHDEWAKIPVDRCKTLVSSYASRLKAVITVKGCCTKY
uniref:Tc1-like transposase DDE domain-containing protein n=1 Tax=Leptobrachium leishanense TaxID=445787 RepID=A0A8C5MWR5_9ANUR